MIFGFPFARLADRSTRKNIVAGALAAWSVMTMLCGAATGFWSLFIMRMGVGVGEGASGPAGQSLLADYFRREQLRPCALLGHRYTVARLGFTWSAI